MIVFKGNKGKNKGKQPKKGMKKPLKCCDFRGFHLVRETGLEPASTYVHMNLNHARLPIPPFPQNTWWAGVDSNHRSQ